MFRPLLIAVLAFPIALTGCPGSHKSSSHCSGSSAVTGVVACDNDAGTSEQAPVPTLATFKACGGDPRGRWTVEDIEFNMPQLLAMFDQPECKDAIRSVDVTTTGTANFTEGGDAGVSNADLDATYQLMVEVRLNNACLSALAGATISADAPTCTTLGNEFAMSDRFAHASCSFGSQACDCALTTVAQPLESHDTYQIQGNDLVFSDGSHNAYCASGNSLALLISSDAMPALLILKR